MKIRILILSILVVIRLLPGIIRVFQYENGRGVRITGKVVKIEQKEANCTVKVGSFLVDFNNSCRFEVGDRITVIGKVKSRLLDKLTGDIQIQPSGFYIVEESRKNDNASEVKPINWGKVWREKLGLIIAKNVPEPEAGLVSGVVLGDKGGLSREWYQRLIESGTIHIVVASGYNVMLVGGMVLGISLVKFKRFWSSLIAIGGMVIYGVIAGAEPPVIRAVIMGGVVIFSQAVGRRSQWWWSLLLAVSSMVLIEPSIITSISFQLTVAASIGIFWLEPFLDRWVQKLSDKIRGLSVLGRTEITSTISAQVFTLPLIWWHFGRVNYNGLLSNVLILPLVPVVMILGGLTIISGLVFPLITPFIAGFLYACAFIVMEIIRIMSI